MELGELLLQFLVNILRAADEAEPAHAVAMRIERLVGRFDHPRMRAETEIVVCAEVQHRLLSSPP